MVGVSYVRFFEDGFRRHKLVSVPMVFPPRPGEGLLFGEIPVLGETGDPVRRNRGFKLDAWHDWFPLRTAIHGRASTCEPSPVKPAHESEALA